MSSGALRLEMTILFLISTTALGAPPVSTSAAAKAKAPPAASAHSSATEAVKKPVLPPKPVPSPTQAPVSATPVVTGGASPSLIDAGAPTLSWAEAVKIARTQNSDVHAADATVDQNDALIKTARGNYLPTLSAVLQTTKSETEGTFGADQDAAKLNLSANLFRGFADQARVDQAERNFEAATASRDLTLAQVSASLKTAYQGLIVAEKSVVLSDDIIARRKRNFDLVQLRFEGGRENKGSVLLSKANYDQAVLERLQAANSVEAARVTLARVLGSERLSYGALSSTVPVNAPPLQVDFEAIAAQSPELRQAIASERAAQEGVRVARQNYFPSLDLTGAVGRYGDSWFPNSNQGSITLGLTIPLFEGGRTYYGVQAAQAVATNASAALETALRSKIVSIRTAYNAYVEAVEREKVAQSFVTAAETRAEIGRSKYNTGLLSFEEWDLIENDLVTRQRNALSTQNDRVSAEAAWEQAQGHGVFQ